MKRLNTNRRRFLGTSLALSIAPALSLMTGKSDAASAMPDWVPPELIAAGPYFTAVGFVVSAVSAIETIQQNQQIIAQLAEIDSKLSQVINMQQEILTAITSLPKAMAAAVQAGWEQEYGRSVAEAGNEFGALLAANQSNPRIRERWNLLQQKTSALGTGLANMDYGVFPFLAHSLVITSIANRKINMPVEYRRAYFKTISDTLNPWLRGDQGIWVAVSDLKYAAQTHTLELVALPNSRIQYAAIPESRGSGFNRCVRVKAFYAQITGNVLDGYSYTPINVTGPWQCPTPPRRTVSFLANHDDPSIGKAIDRVHADMDDLPPTVPDIPPQTGIPEIDGRNLQRAAIFNMQRKAWDLQQLEKMVPTFQTQITSPGFIGAA